MAKPTIRFIGFDDEWEQRKLDDVAEFSKGSGYSKGDLIESGTPIILYGRLYTKYETIISDIDTFVEAEDGSVYSKGGEVIIPASGETAEDIARAASVDKSGVLLGGDLNVVMPNKDINSAFLAISISNGSSQRELARKAQGKSVVHIHNEEIRNLVVPFPTMTEQNKIENYFTDLDHLITLHQRKCDETKKLKKYMLQKMFPQNGSKVPEIRFKRFTDEWEQRKLSELSDFISKGATPTTYGYDWQESGIPFFRNDAIKDNQFIYGDFSYISEEANETLQRSEIHGDDILVAITGDIGKAGIVPKSIEKGNINQHTARVRIIKDAIPYFVYQSLITDEQQKKYQLIKTGLSMPQLSLQQIRDTIVLCPSVEEQSMIGECFINLDHLITLHQRKCEELKKLKKFMLQNMFTQKNK